jgi:DNA repair protein RadA/Sms
MKNMTTGDVQRLPIGIGECDRVLGGGIVPGSLTLLGGDPGIGKSTLVAQIASSIGRDTLYVSGEESAPQVKMRFDRMGVRQEKLSFLNEEHVEVVCKTILDMKPALAIVDSIQTMASSSADSEPGSVKQIKAATVRFLELAKQTGIPIIIIGHVTKGGELGGPKTLEHMVDTVLYLEGDRQQQFRLLRAVKNRFGSTHEIGVFEMEAKGLVEVADPSKIFIEERSRQSGSCLTVVAEGTRLFVVEVQALVNKTVFGYPVRKSSGFDTNRLNVLLAVLEKRAGVQLGDMDVYVNLVGGTSFKDPAMDAAVCMAIVSALSDQPLSPESVAWGEVGLGGELRSPARNQLRAKEAKRFGLTHVIAPKKITTIQQAIQAQG